MATPKVLSSIYLRPGNSSYPLVHSCTQYHLALNSNRNAGLGTTLAAFVNLFLILAFELLNDSIHRVLTSFRLTK